MAVSINRVTLIGSLAKDPEPNQLPSGTVVTNMKLLTTESWQDRQTGRPQQRSEWHNIAAFGNLARIVAERMKKGSHLYIEGRLHTRRWQDPQGLECHVTEVVADKIQILSGRANGRKADDEGEPTDNP